MPTLPKQALNKIVLTDVYKEIKGAGRAPVEKLRTYPSYNQIKIDLPFSGLVVGISGSGKTQLVYHLIKHMSCFSMVYLYVKNPQEPIYEHIASIYKDLEKKSGRKMLYVSSNINDMIEPEDLDPEENNLIIMDDLLTELEVKKKGVKSGQQRIRDLYTKSRKYNGSVLYVTQSYYDTDKLIRKASNYIFIRKVNTEQDLKRILSDYKFGVPIDQLVAMYQYATKNPLDFFMIDMKTNKPELRFRKNFEAII